MKRVNYVSWESIGKMLPNVPVNLNAVCF